MFLSKCDLPQPPFPGIKTCKEWRYYFNAIYILTQSLPSESRCIIASTTLFVVVYLSLLEMVTLALLSTIRYYAVTSQRNLSGRKVIFIAMFTLIVAFIASVTLILCHVTSNIKDLAYVSILFSITYIIYQIVVISASVLLLRYVKTTANESGMNGINFNYQQRATKTVLLLSTSFMLCTFPSVTAQSVSSFIRLKKGEVTFVAQLSLQWSYLLFVLFLGINLVMQLYL